MKLLATPGSLRPDSSNRSLLKAASEIAPTGVNVQIYDGYADLPVFTEPLDNGSIPGGLKNAIDWASRPYGNSPLAGKLALVIGASPSPYGAKWAQADLRRILGVAGTDVIESELLVGPAAELFDADGRLTDESTLEALADRINLLVEATQRDIVPTGAAA